MRPGHTPVGDYFDHRNDALWNAKDNKDRLVPPPTATLELLRHFWHLHRNPLVPGEYFLLTFTLSGGVPPPNCSFRLYQGCRTARLTQGEPMASRLQVRVHLDPIDKRDAFRVKPLS